MKHLFLFCLLCTQVIVNAQDLTGEWYGKHGKIFTTKEWNRLEVSMTQKGNQLTGVSICANPRVIDEYSICALVGTVNGSKVKLYEDSLISLHLLDGSWCLELHRGELIIDSVHKLMIIHGVTETHKYFNRRFRGYTNETCPPGEFIIIKPFTTGDERTETVAARIREMLRPDSLATIAGVAPVTVVAPVTGTVPVAAPPEERRLEVLQTFNVTSDSLTLSFYDDGEPDGDTITVYYNNKIVLNRQLLSGKPLIVTVPVTAGAGNELVMFADNVGSIPPNTALMIFYDKGIRREVRINSDTKKSGAVVLRKNSTP